MRCAAAGFLVVGSVGLVVLIVFAAVVFGTLLFCVLGWFCGLWIGGVLDSLLLRFRVV